tara:strand:- start:66 stop:449 length:384 start_codon:yes stop_codon:yes gene_type:complete
MFIINGITNFLSVAPDSFAPLKHTSAINLIFWLALSLFFLENSLIMLVQYGLQGISKFIPIDLTGGVVATINQFFMTSGFPLKFAHLFKPFSSFLYTFIYIIIVSIGFCTSTTNGILSFFTDKQIKF